MTIAELKEKNLIIYECISGSKAYGLDLPTSDTDIRGVFILPKEQYYGLNYIPQVADETNDIVYYELGRYFELLGKNNPNILELLATPSDKINIKHPFLNEINPAMFISKKCKDSFGGYAFTQVKKARGLNKKIVNPIDKKKKTILDFCYILHEQGSITLHQWLDLNQIDQTNCGLVNVPHTKDLYGIYLDKNKTIGYKGIMKKDTATKVLLSSIPENEKPSGHLFFNQDGYVKYCKDYKGYWDWVEKRNQSRYQNNIAHGKNYDSKNMMHTFRLLDMANEILTSGKIIVKRPNRDELLTIRRGEADYDDLIERANKKMINIEKAYEKSTLQEAPNLAKIEALLVKLRMKFYAEEK